MEYVTYIEIGPVTYRLHTSDHPMVVHTDCDNFVVSNPGETYLVDCEIKLVSRLQEPEGQLVHQSSQRLIYQDNSGHEHRVNIWGQTIEGIYHEVDATHIRIEIVGNEGDSVHITTNFLELVALDVALLSQKSLVLHSAFIEYRGKAILFTAPSGTGKSTQARLWGEYEGVPTINGDRSIIQQTAPGQYTVHGLPFCGTSRIHEKKSMPLGAIIFIGQHPDNMASPMPPAQAYTKLYGEMSINGWNPTAVNKSLEIISDLINAAPMVHLLCNMEQDAVNTLKAYLASTESIT